MAKICWKCHKEVPEGSTECCWCGAGFATGKYQTDGRTISEDTAPVNDYIYVKPRRSKILPIAIVITAVIIFAGMYMAADGNINLNGTDLSYDYEYIELFYSGDTPVLSYHVALANNKMSAFDASKAYFILNIDGMNFWPTSQLSGWVYEGYYLHNEMWFVIGSEYVSKISSAKISVYLANQDISISYNNKIL